MSSPFGVILEQLSILLESAALDKARKEINPLRHHAGNPVKEVVKKTVKARRTRLSQDISHARLAHRPAIAYAKKHGLPNLENQLRKHQTKLPKPIKPKPKTVKTLKKRTVDS